MVAGCCLSSSGPSFPEEVAMPEGASFSKECMRLTNFDLNAANGNRDKYMNGTRPQYHLFDYLDELFPGINGAPNLAYYVSSSNSVPGFVENVYPRDIYYNEPLPHAATKNPLTEAYSQLIEEGELEEGENLGCGPIALFTLLDYYAREGGCPWIYEWQQEELVFESQVELMKQVWDCSWVVVGSSDVGTGMLPLWFSDAISRMMNMKEMGGLWTMKRLSYIDGAYPDREAFFKSVIDAGYPFVINCGPSSRFYGMHYITVTGYEQWTVRTMHDTKQKLMFRVNENWMRTEPCYYDMDWLGQDLLDDVWVLLPDGDVSILDKIAISAEDMPFGTGYPGVETPDYVSVGTSAGAFEIETRRLRAQNYEDECIVLSPRRENFGNAWIEFRSPVPLYRAELDVSFWRSWEKEYIEENAYNLEFGTRSAPASPFMVDKDYMGKIDRISQERAKPCIIPFGVPNYGLRIETGCLGIGDSNKGRFVINELRVWVDPLDVERHLQGTL